MTAIKALLNPRMLIVFLMGFSSGLPLLLIGSTLKAWFTDAGMSLTAIGFATLIMVPYNFKFLWAPFLDRFVPPFLGRRRGWLLISQTGLVITLSAIALSDPKISAEVTAALALITCIISATQDIAIDAYRREFLTESEFALGNTLAITGYRLAMIVAGALALYIASASSWTVAYFAMAGCALVGLLTTLLSPEPVVEQAPPKNLEEAFTGPLMDFLRRKDAIWFLLFIILYKLGDSIASDMTMPFYLRELKFTKVEVATVTKLFGLLATIGGGFLGAAVLSRLRLLRSLFIFGVLQSISVLGFVWLAYQGHDISALTIVIVLENLAIGMATAAFVTFMAGMTNRKFTGTQYALLSSLTGLSRFVSSGAGWLAETYGWTALFSVCAAIAIPGLLILFKIKPAVLEIEAAMSKRSNSASG